MSKCKLALSASINGKEVPNKISVRGSVYVYSDKGEIIVEESLPGLDEKILILNVTVVEHEGKNKGICTEFPWSKEVNGQQYNQVTINCEGMEPDTIPVKYFG